MYFYEEKKKVNKMFIIIIIVIDSFNYSFFCGQGVIDTRRLTNESYILGIYFDKQ